MNRPASFGEAAARLCGLVAALLGWRPGEFWDATPAELALILAPQGAHEAPPDGATIEALRRLFPDG